MTVPLSAIDLIIDVLTAAGIDAVDAYDASALSAPGRVIVTEQTGSAAHLAYSFRPSLQITVYHVEGWRAARALGYAALEALRSAQADGTSYAHGGVHRLIVTSTPARADITGLPSGVGRVTAQFDLVLSTEQHWGLSD
jgi:hypothetical protein